VSEMPREIAELLERLRRRRLHIVMAKVVHPAENPPRITLVEDYASTEMGEKYLAAILDAEEIRKDGVIIFEPYRDCGDHYLLTFYLLHHRTRIYIPLSKREKAE